MKSIGRRPLALVLAGAILGGVLGCVLALTSPKSYVSKTTQYFVASAVKSPDQLAALNTVISNRSQSYLGMVTSTAVLQPVIDQLHLEESTADLAGKTKTTIAPETLLLEISVADSDPERARQIVEAIAASTARYIPQIEGLPTSGAKLELVEVDTASAATAPSGPSLPVNGLIGAALGSLAGFAAHMLLRGRAWASAAATAPATTDDGSRPMRGQSR